MATYYDAWRWRFYDPIRKKRFTTSYAMSDDEAKAHFDANRITEYEKCGSPTQKVLLGDDELRFNTISKMPSKRGSPP